jgi:hypothetical protein
METTRSDSKNPPKLPRDPASYDCFFGAYTEDVVANAREHGIPVVAGAARLALRSHELSPQELRDHLHTLDTVVDEYAADKTQLGEALVCVSGILAEINPPRHAAQITHAFVHEQHLPPVN